jgi:hypothetical protein
MVEKLLVQRVPKRPTEGSPFSESLAVCNSYASFANFHLDGRPLPHMLSLAVAHSSSVQLGLGITQVGNLRRFEVFQLSKGPLRGQCRPIPVTILTWSRL